MAKVTLNKEAEAKPTSNSVDVTDARGRVITVKKPHFLAQFHLAKALGETARNTTYMAMVSPVTYVAAIDGQPEPMPMTEMEIEALLQRLDEDGFAAVMQAIEEHFSRQDTGAREQIKN